ncbi:MAG: adenosine kinase [Candidatus Aminicenantes bacterium]|nr:adenosine kinase [Candidatus Aminicenantes bacterium]
MSKIKGLLGIGNALVDILIPIDNDGLLDELGLIKGGMILIDREMVANILERTKAVKLRRSSGGSVANSISGLARLGLPTGFVGTIGDDEFGVFFNSDMTLNSTKTHLFKGSRETGKSIALISTDTERTLATYLGAAGELHRCQLSDDMFKSFDYILLEAYMIPNHQMSEKVLKLAKKANIKIAIDFSSFNVVDENRDYLDRIVREYVDIVFANEEEARIFTNEENPDRALAKIAKKCDLGVVKCGIQGSLIQRNNQQYHIEAIPVKAIDTTGAGDLYNSGFFYGLLHGYSIEVCGKLGAILGGKVVEVIGSKMNEEKWEEVWNLIKNCLAR